MFRSVAPNVTDSRGEKLHEPPPCHGDKGHEARLGQCKSGQLSDWPPRLGGSGGESDPLTGLPVGRANLFIIVSRPGQGLRVTQLSSWSKFTNTLHYSLAPLSATPSLCTCAEVEVELEQRMRRACLRVSMCVCLYVCLSVRLCLTSL